MIYSAGIIPFRINKDTEEIEFFVGHPGGHKWNTKNYWAFLKGHVEKDESWVTAAIREFKEESGLSMEECDPNMLIPLGAVQQNAHKTVIAFGLHYPDISPDECESNLTEEGFPEIDLYRWMTFKELKDNTHPTHFNFYEQIIDRVQNNG